MSLRVVFMGTPEFAVPSLNILLDNGYDIVGVITATDKKGGRGNKKLIESAIKKIALSKGLKVLQPKNLKSPSFQEELRDLQPDLQVVVAFRMLPTSVIDIPNIGTLNLHGALLPKYRGAAPINWAVINGEKETGVTTFFIEPAIDTGDMILKAKTTIDANETAGDIHDRLMLIGAETVLKTVKLIESGNYELEKQDDSLASPAPKIYHETCNINFDQTTQNIHNFIRGLSPYPTAWTKFDEKELKIYKSEMEVIKHDTEIGTFITDKKSFLKIATQDGFIHLKDIQLQGKKRMNVKSFLNGYRFE